MRKLGTTIGLIGALTIFAAGCVQHRGQLAIFFTDSAGLQATTAAAQQVAVEVTQVDVLDARSGQFVTLFSGSVVHELLGLQLGGALLALGNELEEGDYTQIRIRFSEANSSVINLEGRRKDLRIETPEIVVPVLFPVVENQSIEVALDFDVDASVRLKANGEWVLRPVIRQTTDF